ncbi:Cyclin-G-associated kinase [Geodia barretti]|nr:Cyclin-G-associated kinase [Geodia barretti]
MSFPHEDSHHANSLWEVREFLETRHPSQYLVFNLSGHAYDTAQLNNQVADFAWPHKQMPDLEKLVNLCRNLDSWLRADKQNVIVLHCTDGRLVSALVVTAYLLFLNAFTSPLVPLKLFTFKRSLDIQIISPSPSQLRYLGYIMDLVGTKAYKPHSTSVTITALQMSSVPLFNAIKTGCKPFVEVFQNGERVFTSASHDTMDQIQSFSSDSGGVLVPLGTKVRGNVQVIIHHIRAIPIGRKANLGMTAVRMFQFQFHTGFVPPSSNTLNLERHELDGIVSKKEDRFPSPFQVLLGLEWDQSGEPCSPGISWQNLPHPTSSPLPAFSSLLEQEEIMKQFYALKPQGSEEIHRFHLSAGDMSVGSQLPNVAFYPHHHHQRQQGGYPENQGTGGNGGRPPQEQTPEPAATTTTAPQPPQSAKDFFSRLDWQGGESGYTAFAGESESDSDESSSSSEEEGNQEMFGQSPFGTTHTNHTPMPQLNGSSTSGGGLPHTTGPTLIKFGSESDSDGDDDNEPGQPQFRPPPQTAIPAPHQKSTFGDFDPWGPTATARSMNLLDLEDNLSPPSDSEQSEVRTVGTEAFKKKSSSLRSSPSPAPGTFSNQFDPFGGSGHRNSGGSGGDMFGNPGAFGHSGSSESLLKPAPSSSSQHTGGSSLLSPNIGGNNFHSSAPNVSSLSGGNGAFFTPTLSNIPQSPTASSHGGRRSMSAQQGNSGMTHGFSSGGRTSPFGGGLNLVSGSSVLGHHSQSTEHLQQQMGGRGGGGMRGSNRGDPFADLGNVKVGGGQSPTKSPSKPHTAPLATTGRPGYQYYNQKQTAATTAQTRAAGQTSKKPGGRGSVQSGGKTSYQPNYSSSVLGDRREKGPRPKMGVRQPLKKDDFSDLLSSQGFSKPAPGPRTLKDMRKESDIEGSIDPDRARVRDWAEGKERNIRALLSSLHTILWEGEPRWSECGMQQLIQPDQVRKMFRKACLSVHPDKAQDTEHETLARAIFDELNDAYARFEESGAQPLY